MTTPNGYSLKRIIRFLQGEGLGENPFEEFNKLSRFGYRGHIREYSAKELKIFLEKTEFNVKDVFYVYYPHRGLKKKPFLSFIAKVIYTLFPRIRSHLIIMASRK